MTEPRDDILFLDIEASGLDERGYPIEIGWVDADGSGDGVLIRPARRWTWWSRKAEGVHGISREELEKSGLPAEEAARRVADAVANRTVYVDAPAWDRHWLLMLLSAADLHPDYDLRPLDEAIVRALAPLARALPPAGATPRDRRRREARLMRRGKALLAQANDDAGRTAPRSHRAQADARHAWTIWRRVGQLVTEFLEQPEEDVG